MLGRDQGKENTGNAVSRRRSVMADAKATFQESSFRNFLKCGVKRLKKNSIQR